MKYHRHGKHDCYLPNDKKETNKTVQRINKSEDGQDRISLYGWNHGGILSAVTYRKISIEKLKINK